MREDSLLPMNAAAFYELGSHPEGEKEREQVGEGEKGRGGSEVGESSRNTVTIDLISSFILPGL